MALTKTERRALELLRARLDCRHPGHSTECIKGQPVQLYVDSWCLPLLDFLLDPEGRMRGDAGLFVDRPHATMLHVARETRAREALQPFGINEGGIK